MAINLTTNTKLASVPEISQNKDPILYSELLAIHNVILGLQASLDGIYGFGGLLSTPGAVGTKLTSTGPNTPPVWV